MLIRRQIELRPLADIERRIPLIHVAVVFLVPPLAQNAIPIEPDTAYGTRLRE